jgi:hypothetical protein
MKMGDLTGFVNMEIDPQQAKAEIQLVLLEARA